MITYGLVLARGAKTSQDWFLGKRSLAWWAIGLSMFATNVDNADLVSLTGTTYNEGLHIIMVHTLGSLLGASFAAFFLVPAMARAGQFTNAEYLEGRFGPVARVLSARDPDSIPQQHAGPDDLVPLPVVDRIFGARQFRDRGS